MHLLHHKRKAQEPPIGTEVPPNSLPDAAASSIYEPPPAYESNPEKSTANDTEKQPELENGEKPKRKRDHSYKIGTAIEAAAFGVFAGVMFLLGGG